MEKANEYIHKFESEGSVTLSLVTASDEILNQIFAVLSIILIKEDREFLTDTIITCVREIILNAVKANAKRVYFKKLELDINNPEDYSRGMADFKNIIADPSSIKHEISESGYRVIVKISRNGKSVDIAVTGNSGITPEELNRVSARINQAKDLKNFNEAYAETYDPAEGAGLGIILTILLLRNAGIRQEYFSFFIDGNMVTTRISIPERLWEHKIVSSAKAKIYEAINTLPTFPEHIIQLQALCMDPAASIDEITNKISGDPSLTADLLKLANSAGFITSKRIESISEAVIVIGLKNLYSLLLTAASRRILDASFKKFETVWDHCNMTALYARLIADDAGLSRYAENAFTAGLLHDIGKIVLLTIDPQTSNAISEMMKQKRIRSSIVLEEISIGISHAEIGASIAERWNFPEFLIETIRRHNNPLSAKEEYRQISVIVYLANILCNIERQQRSLSHIEAEAVKIIGINTTEQVTALHKKLQGAVARKR
jgi:putative nucleotidyltransferase with HDIG domain